MESEYSPRGAKGLLEAAILKRSAELGRRIQSTGASLERVGEQLREFGADPAAKLADEGAVYARRFGSYLATADLDTMLHDAETFARRQPAFVVAGGFALGIVAARVLKAGSGRRYRQYGDRATYEREDAGSVKGLAYE